ncbi:MAG: PD40 domain-containing protein [Gemmatimonadota bacterium]|nr:PD40 domain-containing protein [Gemmatimonadota bacterium]MDE3215892.1 PD40 domain-containing protein [Gemmatimonadota bacterium]
MSRRAAALLGLALCFAAGRPLAAQDYFGQNQVQYARFDWHVLETEHFLIYYYPAERAATMQAARMAERDYARLSRILDHKFIEKKPIILYASRTDFAQNNVTGDLGEATSGVTEAVRQRMLLNFTGDLGSFEHVLTHEMVHAFQYDVFARGHAGAGLQTLAQVNPPLWYAEGMAEYLSLGPTTALTDAWMRDAALNGHIPTIEEMTDDPDKYFPYRYGHSLWAYIGQRWGDDAIGQILRATPSLGVAKAIKRSTGLSLDDLGEEWKEYLQRRYLPAIATLQRVRDVAKPLLNPRQSGGSIFLAPTLSPDGKYVAFLANGSRARGQVFIDLWLADARTGKRVQRLVQSTTNPNFEELRVLYSQSAFSPDGTKLAFAAQFAGRDVLYVLDVATRKILARFDQLPFESVTNPTWSPDGTHIAFSGNHGGITDLCVVRADGTGLERLTANAFAELQPAWSPDGKTIAFVTDSDADASLAVLRFAPWRIALFHLDTHAITLLPGQAGLNLNPQWSPDGSALAYVSDRTGTANIFLYDFHTGEQYQLTDLAGAVSGITEYSPAISWARDADRLAFTYFEDGKYTVWTLDHPRALARTPYRAPVAVARAPAPVRAPLDSTILRQRSDTATVTVAAMLDSMSLGLPDTARFRDRPAGTSFFPEYVARPTIGYAPDNYGRNVFGGTTVVLSDMLGDHRLAMAAEINGRVSEARAYIAFTNLAHRWQYTAGFAQSPFYFLTGDSVVAPPSGSGAVEHQQVTTYVARQVYGLAAYPFNRFARVELGGGFNNIDRERWYISRTLHDGISVAPFTFDSTRRDHSLNYVDAQAAYVFDNSLYTPTGPIAGQRYRLQVTPVFGSYDWVEYLADYRRYDPIVFNYLTVATRLYANVAVGRDETAFPKYIARPDYVRGYDRNNQFYSSCPVVGANASNCSALQLLGSRVLVGNVELRFPLVQKIQLGGLPFSFPPLDGLLFYDEGLAWSRGQAVYGSRPTDYDLTRQRYPLRSYGFGIRLNLFDYALISWNYAIPLDAPGRHGFWTWSLWPSF